jgi:spore germination protein KC
MTGRGNAVARTAVLAVGFGILTGCWDRQEINDLALVTASGLDLAENGQLEATLQIALPPGITGEQLGGGTGTSGKATMTITQRGKDGADTLNKMQEQLSRKIYFGYRGVDIIGEQYARHGVDQVLDQLSRAPFSRYNSFLLTTHGASAKDVLNAQYVLEEIPGVGINKIQARNNVVSVKMSEYVDELSRTGIMPVTGAIRLVKGENGETTFRIDEAAVYRNYRLAGFLSEPETRMLLCLKGKGKRVRLTAWAQPATAGYKGTVGCEIRRSSAKIHTLNNNGKPEVTIHLKASGVMIENDTKLDTSKNMELLNRTLTEELRRMVLQLIRHAQKELKVDIFGIGEKIHVQHPHLWQQVKGDWDRRFPDVPIAVEVDFEIDRTGRTQVPAQLEKKDISPAEKD